MPDTHDTIATNNDQAEFWNGKAGEHWVETQDFMDTLLSNIGARLFEIASPAPSERVVDLGCGTGVTTLELARRVGPEGAVLALDISKPMLGRAEARAAEAGLGNARFIVADAQTHDFGTGGADLLMSRFGSMFFEDPPAAFANLLTALRPSGRIALVTWAEAARNPFFAIPTQAAVERLGKPEPTPPRAPGPMAFAEIDYVEDILRGAGFADVSGVEETATIFHPGGAAVIADHTRNGGPGSRIMRAFEASPETIDEITATVEARLKTFERTDGIHVPATVNFYRAVRR